MWTARKIIKELADADRRQQILTAFWKHADQNARFQAVFELSEALKYRPVKIRKMPIEKKTRLLSTRLVTRDFDDHFETALVNYLSHEVDGMMGAFLDHWEIAHDEGTIEEENVAAPSIEKVREAVQALSSSYEATDVAIYFATAGLLMDESWRDAMWPVVDELRPSAEEG